MDGGLYAAGAKGPHLRLRCSACCSAWLSPRQQRLQQSPSEIYVSGAQASSRTAASWVLSHMQSRASFPKVRHCDAERESSCRLLSGVARILHAACKEQEASQG